MSHIENQAVLALLAQDPGQHTLAMAQALSMPEGDLIRALPRDMVTLWSGEQSEALLAQLASWGQLTTIVESCGSIFEFKGPEQQQQFLAWREQAALPAIALQS